MEEKKKSKLLWVIICIVILAVIGGCIWYFQYKKPHDEAVSKFNAAAKQVTKSNTELEEAIASATAVLDSDGVPYDEATINDLTVAISEANTSKRKVPEIPEKTEEIKKVTKSLLKPLDYDSVIANLAEKQTALENSIAQMAQITNPSGDFVIQRLQGIEGISACQAVTEDHDPNGNLNKQGGYTATIYFSSPWINQDEVYGGDIVDKGTECGGAVEVYASKEDAESRNAYLSNFDGAGILNPGSHVVLGTIVIRTSSKLTATQQNDLTQRVTDNLIKLE